MNKPIKALAVLIVEDSENDAQFIVRLLKKADYELVYEQVETAEQMRAALEKHAWDIVISDYKLPQFDGRAALKLLQEIGRDIPFIVVSGTIGEETAVAMMKAGAHDYLIKGDLARLVPAVERELEQAGIRRERRQAEDALHIRERAIASSFNGVAISDFNGRLTYVNDAFMRMWGYTIQEALNLNALDLASNRDEIIGIIDDIRGKGFSLGESVARRKDGSLFTMQFSANLVTSPSGETIGMCAIFVDITERARIEEALRKSEARYRAVVHSANDAIISADSMGNIVSWTPGAERIFGYTEIEVHGQPITLLMPARYHKEQIAGMARVRTGGEIHVIGKTIELEGLRKDGSEFPLELSLSEWQVNDEKYYTAIIRDITERKRAEERIVMLAHSMQSINECVCITDTNNNIVFVNRAFLDTYGYAEQELIGKNISLIRPSTVSDEVSEKILHLSMEGGWHGELMNKRQDGNEFPISLSSTAIRDNEGKPIALIGVATDITARKQAEAALRESEARYRSLFDRMLDGMYRSTHAGKFVDVNPAMVKMFGYSSKEEMLEMDIKTELYFDPEERGTHIIDTGGGETDVYRLRRKDGSEIWVEDRGTYTYDEQGRIVFHEGMMRDVTERVQAEEALRQSEARFRTYVQQANDYIFTLNPHGQITSANQAMCETLGYDEKELLGVSALELVASESEVDVAQALQRIWVGENVDTFELPIQTRAGKKLFVQIRGRVIYKTGQLFETLHIARDITEQVWAKEALAASEAELRALFASMQDVVLVIDREGVYRKIAPTNPGLLVKPPAELLGRNLRDVFPSEQAGSFIGTVRQVLDTKQTVQIEYELLVGDRNVWFETSISPMDKDSTLWVARDVGERKRAEEALRASEERFHTLYDNATVGLYRTTPDGRILMLNPAGVRILGYGSFDEIAAQRNLENPEFQADHPRKEFREKLEREGTIFDLERKMKKKDGSIIFVRESAKVFRDENGEVLYYDGSFEDITERKQAEEALRASEERYRELFNSMIDGFALHEIICDENGEPVDYRFLEVNPAFERLTGFQSADLISKTVLAVMPNTEPYWIEIYGNVALTGRSTFFENYSGELGRYFEVSAYCPRPGQFAVVMVDITERKQAEEALNRHAEELTALQATVLDISSPHPLPELLNLIVERAANLLGASSGGLYLTEPEHRRVRCLISYKTKQDFTGTLLDYGVGAAGYVAETGKPIIIDDYHSWSGRAGVYEDEQPFQAVMSAPLLWQGKVTGVIHLLRDDASQKFTQEELNLLLLFANHAAVAVENARLFKSMQQRVMDLEVLYESGLALSQLLDLKEIGRKIIELLEEKLDWHHTTIRLYHPNDESLELLAFIQPGLKTETERRAVEEHFKTLISRSGEGLSGWAVQNSQTVRSGDVSNDPRYAETFPGLHSGLYVPMKLGERMIGVISIESEQPDAFSEADERLITTLANQAASAFENARLFDETHQRVTELEMLYQSGLSLSQLLNPKEIGQKILELLEEKLGWHHTRIRLYHPNDESLELLAFNQPGVENEKERLAVEEHFKTRISKSGEGLSGWAVQNSQTVRSGDVSNDPRYAETFPGLHSGLYVPIKLGERIIGVISIESEQPDAFSEADERLVTTLANQAASAFENARLFGVARQRVMEVETLNRISLVMRTVSKQDEMLAIVLDEALAILNTSHGSIELWDEVNDILLKKAVRGWSAQVIESPQKSDEGISGRVITSSEIYVSREFASDPMMRAESRDQVPPGWGGACLPIRTAQQTLGVLVVSVPSERELNRDEIRLLSTLAEMTGSALHRMQLFDETARRAEEFASLYETSKILSAENELDALLQTIVEHAKTFLHTTSSVVNLYDKEREELEVVVGTDPAYAVVGMRLRLGEGAAGRVAQNRQPLRIADYSTWEGRSQKYAGIPFRAVLEVPMLYGGELVGVLSADEIGDSERKFTEADERLLSLFALQAAGAIHSARLHEETVHRLEHLQALRAVDQAIASSLDMRLTLNIILTHALPQLGVDAADVLLLYPGSNLLEFTSGRGFRTRMPEGASIGVGESFAGRAIMEHRTVMALDLKTAEQDPQFGKFWKEEGFSCYWCVPLIAKGEARGVLEVYRRTVFTPDAEWLEFLETLAGQAAIAIENTQLFENLQRANTDLILAYNATIEGWSRALDLRDKETEGHTERVADLTVTIAKTMGIKDQGMLHIWRGALLHDIGKMGIPDTILLKPDKLTDEEWVIMRTHPQLARDLLRPIAYLREALDIPYSHHEKWDGTGYPQGLKGQQIPLTARFFAVVDVWDALTSDRPYRKKWTKKRALTYIHEQRGRHFDPQVVDAFEKIVKVN